MMFECKEDLMIHTFVAENCATNCLLLDIQQLTIVFEDFEELISGK